MRLNLFFFLLLLVSAKFNTAFTQNQFGRDAVSGKTNTNSASKSASFRWKAICKGEKLYDNYQFKDAHFQFEQALEKITNKKDTLQFWALIGLAKVETKQGKFPISLKHLIIALNIANSVKNEHFQGLTWNLIGIIHWKEGKNKQAIHAYQKSISFHTGLKDSLGLAEAYNNLGIIYKINHHYHSAMSLYNKALAIRKNHADLNGVSQTLFNIGSLKSETGQINEALFFYDESFKIKQKLGNEYGLLPYYLNVGDLYTQSKQYKEAQFHFEQGLKKAELLGAKDYIMSFKRELAQMYAKKGDFQNAYLEHVEYMREKDSLINSSTTEKLAELEVIYKTDEKQQYIHQLKLEKALNAEKLQKESYIRYALFLILFFALSIVLIILYKDRKLRTYNKLLIKEKLLSQKREKENELLAREMHHRVKNNLQLSSSLLKLQSRNVLDIEAKTALLDARNRIQAISMIHQQLYSNEDLTHIDLAEYLPHLSKLILQSNSSANQHIQLHESVQSALVSIDSAMTIGLFLNEVLLNSIKHAFTSSDQPELSISLTVSNHLQLIIKDNGSGISLDHNSENFGNFGFQLLRSFAKKLSGTLLIIGSQGTTIQLTIPKTILNHD